MMTRITQTMMMSLPIPFAVPGWMGLAETDKAETGEAMRLGTDWMTGMIMVSVDIIAVHA